MAKLRTGWSEFGSGQRKQRLAAPLPATKLSVPGIPDTFASCLKQTEGEAARLPSFSDEVDSEWSYTSITHVFRDTVLS